MSAKTFKYSSSPAKKLIAALIILVVVLAVLELTNTTHVLHKTSKVSTPTAPITELPAQPSANNGQKDVSTPTSTVNQGSSIDKKGQTPSSVSSDKTQWLASASGKVTVKTPAANSTFSPGGYLYGSASINRVQYRLIDDQVGVISQGFIDVVDGNFSAVVNFKAGSNSGRLDVFSTDTDGAEVNEVQVPVRL